MNSRPPTWLLAALALALSISPAPAVVVALDFEEAPVPALGSQIGIAEYAEDGFYIKPLGPVDAVAPFRLRRNGGSSTGFPENGSPYLQFATGDSFVMTLLSGVPFAPVSVDIAEFSDLFSSVAVEVTFIGHFADTSTVSTTFTTDGVIDGTGPLDDFETFSFSGLFTGIIRLEVADIPDPIHSFSLDHLLVDNVPEPSRALLLTLAFALTFFRRHRPAP